jgi:tetratricopeptide (TPR) repeat protein
MMETNQGDAHFPSPACDHNPRGVPLLNTKAAFSIASESFQKGHYTRALEQLNQLIDIDKSPKSYALLAKTLAKLGFKAEAANAYELAGRQKPYREDYLREAMLLHFDCGHEDEVLAIGSLIFAEALKDPDIAFMLAKILLDAPAGSWRA